MAADPFAVIRSATNARSIASAQTSRQVVGTRNLASSQVSRPSVPNISSPSTSQPQYRVKQNETPVSSSVETFSTSSARPETSTQAAGRAKSFSNHAFPSLPTRPPPVTAASLRGETFVTRTNNNWGKPDVPLEDAHGSSNNKKKGKILMKWG